jgi:hypothetical protein
MKIAKLLFALVFLLCVISTLPMVKAQAFDAPEVDLLAITPEMAAAAENALQGCEPQEGKTTGEINKNGVYTLTGDLFHNGRIYALIDDDADVILCEWQKPLWKPVSAVNVQTAWSFPPGYRELVGRGADGQPQPFWMIELQNRPLLVIASDVEKEGQYYYVILFDSKCEKILSSDSSFGRRPEVKDQYLLTGDSSRVKSDWGATYFSRIQNNTFVMMKSWEDSQPWHAEDREGQPDDSSNYASSNGKGYLILPDNSASKQPADYVVLSCDPKEKRSYLYPGEMHGKQYAAVYFTPNQDVVGADTLVYLFVKLTGLPRELFPDDGDIDIVKGKSEPHWKIKVTGSDTAIIKLLSPDSAR